MRLLPDTPQGFIDVFVRFLCQECDYPGRLELPGQADWRCPRCDHIANPLVTQPAPVLTSCVMCGCDELYKKKDFPHGLGMAILVFACLASTITYYLYDKWWTWTILIGSAAFDGLLYLWVKDVIVCYRCNAHHRGFDPNASYPPFELTVHEKFRQERLRREELSRSKEVPPRG